MSLIATISVTGVGAINAVSFITAKGFLDLFPLVTEEELTTAGVDGRRWRTISRQFPPFQAQTDSQCADFTQAVNLKRLCELMVGEVCTLTVSIGGRTYIGRDVHILAVMAQPMPGKLIVAGGSASNAYLTATWSLVFTREGDD